ASAWDSSNAKKYSLQRDFVEGESILVLGRDTTQESTLTQLNAIIVKRLSQLLRAQDDAERVALHKQRPLTWIIIDEFRSAGRMDGIQDLMMEGRSKGIANVIGFQDFPGLEEAYGDKLAESIFGQCSNKAFLKQANNTSDEYASRHFGEETIEIVTYL